MSYKSDLGNKKRNIIFRIEDVMQSTAFIQGVNDYRKGKNRFDHYGNSVVIAKAKDGKKYEIRQSYQYERGRQFAALFDIPVNLKGGKINPVALHQFKEAIYYKWIL